MITCPKCFKENQDHYKFCLGCGAELPRDVAPKPFTGNTPPHGIQAAQPAAPAFTPQREPSQPAFSASPQPAFQVAPAQPAFSPPPQAAAQPAPAPAPAGGPTPCPQCGHPNGPNNLFCGSCGFRLGGAKSNVAAPAVAAAPVHGQVVLTALRADGSEAGSYTLPDAAHLYVGRETGHIFASDSYRSPRHASFTRSGGTLTVKDEGSLNGVYRKLTRDVPVELRPNDVFRIGQEIIRFEPIQHAPPSPDGVERLGSPSKGYVGRIALIIGRETTGNAFPVPESGMHLGRERGDVLFPEDGYVSGLHCRLAWDKGKLFLTDLGSSNGTFMRLREETEVRTGDVLLMGQQLFRLSL
ncbi:MAG: FHA domain-containing protein [Myxococcales bacterium]|nr:FHA domain-containing protein [Myxococcales bacterium]